MPKFYQWDIICKITQNSNLSLSLSLPLSFYSKSTHSPHKKNEKMKEKNLSQFVFLNYTIGAFGKPSYLFATTTPQKDSVKEKKKAAQLRLGRFHFIASGSSIHNTQIHCFFLGS